MQELKLQSGRSMVEMLGVLAIVGVLSIGGIMGYSYGMDKYRANQTMQDVNLRGIDVLAQFDRTGDANLNEWQNEKTIYPITLEDETIGIQVDKVPERVCNMLAEGMSHVATGIKVNGTYVTGDDITCDGDENALVFYFDEESVANVPVLEQCGDIICEQCQKCDKSTMTCVAAVEDLASMLATKCISNGYESYCLGDVCMPIGAPECEGVGEPQCVLYEEGDCTPMVSFPCKKDGQYGVCSSEGICELSVDATNCGGVNCVEMFQEVFENIGGNESGYYLPTDCIGCYYNQCAVNTICNSGGDLYFCRGNDTYGLCMPLCSKDSDCGECEKCENSLCEVAQVNCKIDGQSGVCNTSTKECIPLPEDNTCGGEVCEGDIGCSYCKNNQCQIAGSNVKCEKNGEEGYCQQGHCLPICTSKDDCLSNQFCGSPNNSEYEQYVDGNIGVCKDFNFTPIEHNGKTYYLSNDKLSWWDAQAICGQYNNLGLLTKEEVISESISWDNNIPTELGTAILNELEDRHSIYLAEGREFGKTNGNVYLESGWRDYPTNIVYPVVCR